LRWARDLVLYIRESYDGEDVTVMYSGGFDSTLLLWAAVEALGPEHVTAVTVSMPHAPAVVGAPLEGVEFVRVGIDPGPGDCYECKKAMVRAVKRVASGILLDGTNVSEVVRGRPGLRALYEEGVDVPLVKVGIGDTRARWAACRLGLKARFFECPLPRLGFPRDFDPSEGFDPDGYKETEWRLSETLRFTVHAPMPSDSGEGYVARNVGDAVEFVAEGPVTEALSRYFGRCWVI